MTTVVDYQYSIPSAYAFPARPPHAHDLPSGMIKHHPQPLNLNNALHHGIPSPYIAASSPLNPPSHLSVSPLFNPSSRRTNSTSTAVYSASLCRSVSNGSSGSSNAYVTTLRKQKATVWCDRAQREDARLLVAQKAAKARAALEVAKAAAQHGHRSSDSTNSVHKGKISHHSRGGKKGSSGLDHEFSTNRSLVAGVPARLDIDDDNSDSEQPGSGSGSQYGGVARRTNSGRSSINSGGQRRLTSSSGGVATGGARAGTPQLQLRIQDMQNYASYSGTNASSPSTYSRTSSLMETSVPEVPEIVDTHGAGRQEYLMQQHSHRKSNSFNKPMPGLNEYQPHQNYPESQLQSGTLHPSDSFISTSSGESNGRPAAARAISSREPGELRRKGSIDESRTMTMGRVRLFVANPDQ